MKYKNIILFVVCVCLMRFASYGQGCPGAPNIDFEDGLSGWTFYNGSCNSIGLTYNYNFPTTPSPVTPGREDWTSGGVDPWGLFPVVYGGAGHSLRLGSELDHALAEKAVYTFTVPPASTGSYSLEYHFAIVLQDGGHPSFEQPRFEVKAFDNTTNLPIACAQFTYVAGVLPGFTHITGTDKWFLPWTTGGINLADYAGATIRIEVYAGDCAQTAHWGYGYFDMNCALTPRVTSFCYDASSPLNLHAPNGYASYQWYQMPGFTTLGPGSTVQDAAISPAPTSVTTYAVVMNPFPGFGCPETLYVEVHPLLPPVLSPLVPLVLCEGTTGSMTFSSMPVALGGSWSSSDPYVASIDASSGVISGNHAGTAMITYAIPNPNPGCPAVSVSAVVTVNPLPPPPTVEEVTGHHCEGEELIFRIHAATGMDVGYSTTPCPPMALCSGVHLMAPADGGIYDVHVTAAVPNTAIHLTTITNPITGCSRDLDIHEVVCVERHPHVNNLFGPVQVCEGSSVVYNYDVSDVGSGTGTWSCSPAGAVTFTPGAILGQEIITGVTPGTATITLTVTNCCGSDERHATITVNPLPTATAENITICKPVCPFNPISIRICGTPGATVGYTWADVAPGLGGTSGTVTIPMPPAAPCTTVIVTATAEGTGHFQLTGATSIEGCYKALHNTVDVFVAYPRCALQVVDLAGLPAPNPSDIFDNPLNYRPCEGDAYKIRVYGYPNTTHHISGPGLPPGFTLTVPASGLSYAETGPMVLPPLASYYSYWVTQIDGCCIKKPIGDTSLCGVNVLVRPRPRILFGNTGPVCEGESVNLVAEALPGDWYITHTVDLHGLNMIDPTDPTGLTLVSSYTGAPILAPATTPPSTYSSMIVGATPTPYGVYTYTFAAMGFDYVTSAAGFPTYTWPGCATSVSTNVTVNQMPADIVGPTYPCPSSPVIYSNSLPGGTWSSSDPSVVTIDPITGVAAIGSIGGTTITYMMPTGCYKTKNVNVLAQQQKRTTVHCGIGGHETLTNPIPGGTWSSMAPSIVTVDPVSGEITGISVGSAIIVYLAPTGCTYYYPVIVPVGPIDPMPVVTCWVHQNTTTFPYEWQSGFITPEAGVTVSGTALTEYLDPLSPPGSSTWLLGPLSTFTDYPLVGGTTASPGITTYSTSFAPYVTPILPSYSAYHVYLTSVSRGGCTWRASCDSVSARPGGNTADNLGMAKHTLMVVPNPNAGSFTLSGTMPGMEHDSEAEVSVIDMLGRNILVKQVKVSDGLVCERLELTDDVANGVYQVKIKTGSGTKTISFVLRR